MSGFSVESQRIRACFHRWANTIDEPTYVAEACAWLAACLDRVRVEGNAESGLERLLDKEDSPAYSGEGLAIDITQARVLEFHAPLGLLEGAWLQSVAQAANGHVEAVCELLAAYLQLRGEDASRSPVAAYKAHLVNADSALPPVGSWQFSQEPRIGLAALQFASLQLALSFNPRTFFPELLGFTLAYAQSSSNWRLAGLAELSRRSRLHAIETHAVRAVRSIVDADKEVNSPRRILDGHALYSSFESNYLRTLRGVLSIKPDIAERVEAMFRSKVRHASGYHGRVMLADRTLDAWFSQDPFDGKAFLEALACSPYMTGPSGERPLNRLAGFGGPMFGVFSKDELELLDRWLVLATQPASGKTTTGMPGAKGFRGQDSELMIPFELPPADIQVTSAHSSTIGKTAVGGTGARGLFHVLINAELAPNACADAERQVLKILRMTERAFRRRRAALKEQFFPYSPEGLQGWVNAVHDSEVARYRFSERPPKLSRDEYVWGIHQLAPAILVDGCWLQHLGQACYQDDRLHCLLFRIYADELGAGQASRNHPNVYRRLLGSLNISLPPVDSLEFAQHPGFLDAAFDLPVYLLAISRFPKRFLPEILGLNLAIELSGLGAQYQKLGDDLAFWGIDPLIVKLHQSIDNLACGHAALAVEAIQLYLHEIGEMGGDQAVADYWKRIWCGYRSLGIATRRLKWALGWEFCRRFLPARVGQGWARLTRRVA